jgi:hypothetical protein
VLQGTFTSFRRISIHLSGTCTTTNTIHHWELRRATVLYSHPTSLLLRHLHRCPFIPNIMAFASESNHDVMRNRGRNFRAAAETPNLCNASIFYIAALMRCGPRSLPVPFHIGPPDFYSYAVANLFPHKLCYRTEKKHCLRVWVSVHAIGNILC